MQKFRSLSYLTKNNLSFPSPDLALDKPNGLLAVGGDLTPERILAAYSQGIFSWFNNNSPILWWCPDPRAVLLPSELHLSRSTLKYFKKKHYTATLNYDFKKVINACASDRSEGTWINCEMIDAYTKLHQLGIAHSIEVWDREQIVGGLYGLALGKVFFGESMFSSENNASKYALKKLCGHFISYHGQLIDCQIINPYTAALGAKEISRSNFLKNIAKLTKQTIHPDCWQPQILTQKRV